VLRAPVSASEQRQPETETPTATSMEKPSTVVARLRGSPIPPARLEPPTRTAREQLALLLDGASARSRVFDSETLATAAAIAAVLVDKAIPAAALPFGAGTEPFSRDGRLPDAATSTAEVDAQRGWLPRAAE